MSVFTLLHNIISSLRLMIPISCQQFTNMLGIIGWVELSAIAISSNMGKSPLAMGRRVGSENVVYQYILHP